MLNLQLTKNGHSSRNFVLPNSREIAENFGKIAGKFGKTFEKIIGKF